MAEAIVSTILEHLTSLAIEKASEAWTLVTGVEQEVKRLESNFKVLQCELADAEEKQFADERVKLWLERFKEVSYDMEDVLEDWKIAVQQLQTTKGRAETISASTSVSKWKKVPSCLSCFSFGSHVDVGVGRRYDIATRIKEINEQVDLIAKERVKFELIKREIKQPSKRQDRDSTSFVNVSELRGRDSAKEDIISALLSEGEANKEGSDNNIPTIALVGMGGIGKTALAQLVYNDVRIQNYFEHKIWVCVSDPFDQIQIAQAILGVLDPNPIQPHSNLKLEPFLLNIHTKIAGKKFFLVLDDVWTDRAQDWEPFKVALQSGLAGSKILVTTRNTSVADKIAEGSAIFPLDLLSQESCWLILKQVAFSKRNEREGEYLEDIGREIAKKCRGVPLVAKTLGGLLHGKSRRDQWQNVLNNEIWKLPLAEKDIFAPLLLSYFDLPSPMRRCLLYCAIFPKDYRISKDELIRHWMAQGYLRESSVENSNSPTEKGEDYFDHLAAHSFFQDFQYNYIEGPSFKMHDIVHDFLLFLTKSEFVEKEVKCEEDLTVEKEGCRHLRLVIQRGNHFPTSFCGTGTERLRSLVVNNSISFINGENVQKLLSVAKRLRLLEFGLSQSSHVEQIPDIIIGKSIHLRYLGLRGSILEELPEAVCELRNLETLDVRQCWRLEILPDGIGELINLRYLLTDGCTNLTYYPKGIGRLTSIVGLTDIIARVDRNDTKEFSIGDLEDLNLLRGVVFVELVGVDTIDWKELERAKLHKKQHLNGLHISNVFEDSIKPQILHAINPPSNLHVLLGDMRKKEREMNVSQNIQKAALKFMAAASQV